MSKIISLYTCHEAIYDSNGNQINYFETNLPHENEIADAFIAKWNKDADDFMLKFMNEQAGNNKIQSCYAKRYKPRSWNKNKLTIAVEIIAKPRKRLTYDIKNKIYDFMDSQYSDGWGEGFFGPINIMTTPDGTRYCVE